MKPYSDSWREFCRGMMGKKPNPSQAAIEEWWFGTDSRFALILGGERSGKSWTSDDIAIPCMDLDNNKADYWLVGPDYWQPRAEFNYIYSAFKDAGLVQEGSQSMPINPASPWAFTTVSGATWRTRSSGEIAKLASFSVAGFIMCEAAQQPYEVWLKLMGRVSETGGFGILSGTLEKGLPWYEDLYKRWQGENVLGARSWSLPTWSNTDIYPGGRQDPRIKELEAEYPEDLFLERFGAEPARSYGLVLPEYKPDKHIKKLTVNEKLPVELCIDPAQHCYPVLFVQYDGLICNVLDRVYARGKIVHDIIPEVMGNELWKFVDPMRGGVIDNAGKQHHGNKSQIELWQELAGVTLRAQYILMDTSIETLRYRLGDNNPLHMPLVYFNSHFTNAKTPDGYALDVLAEPEMWSWPNRGLNRNVAIKPIDKNNDAMKALAYGLVDRYGTTVNRKAAPKPVQRPYWGVPA